MPETNHVETTIAQLTNLLEALADRYYEENDIELVHHICSISSQIANLSRVAVMPKPESTKDVIGALLDSMGGLK